MAGSGAEKPNVSDAIALRRARRQPCAWGVALLLWALPVGASEPEVSAWITQRAGQAVSPSASIDGLRVGELVEVEVRLTPGTGGVGSYSVSSRFDAERGNVLDVVSVDRLKPAGFSSFPAPPAAAASLESESFRPGQVSSLAALSFPPEGGLAENAGSVPIARLTFRAATEGTTAVEVGSFASATDAILQQDGLTTATPTTRRAVITVPEPCCTGQLLGVVLSLGVLAAFRRRRSAAQPSQAMS